MSQMRDYVIGEKCSGRIINIYQGNLIVELEQGVIGRVLNGAEQESVERGEIIDVVVIQNDDQGILLDFVSVSEKQEVRTGNVANSWNNWKNIPAGHGQAMTAMFALRSHTDAFRRELTEARKKWEDAKSSSQQIFDSVTASVRKQCEDEKQKYISGCESNIKNTEARRNTVKNVVNACNNFINNMPRNSADSAVSAARGGMRSVESIQKEVVAAIDSKVQAYRTLCNCQRLMKSHHSWE